MAERTEKEQASNKAFEKWHKRRRHLDREAARLAWDAGVTHAVQSAAADLRAALQAQQEWQHPDGRCKRWCGDGECKEACVSPSKPAETQKGAIQAQQGDTKDAERYRWLRDHPQDNGQIIFRFSARRSAPADWLVDTKTGTEMDIAIDAAMLAARREG